MPTPANTARATKRWKALIGDDEYQGHTTAIEYNGNSSGTVWKGGDANDIPDVTPGDPTIAITMAEDFENADSLYRLFWDAEEGTPMTLIVYPHYDGTYAYQVDLKTIQPPSTVNRAGGIPEVTVTLPCSRKKPYVPVP
jgi:hypothetical protein